MDYSDYLIGECYTSRRGHEPSASRGRMGTVFVNSQGICRCCDMAPRIAALYFPGAELQGATR